ncbi:MAG TPA: class I SAM-dependent methyltransferase [Chloroflexia bacterium]|nr:class I SAM-dependent methyltransferase [Chloroflexia bacterium]
MAQDVSDGDEQDLDRQYRRPFGEVGRRIGREMARDHLPENLWTIEQLDPQPGDRILEVGFGPGVAVEELLGRARVGFVAGVDFSETMVEEASRRNAEAIAAGRADLRYGEAGELPFADASFDKAFSIHSVYFWSRPRQAFKELWRVLRPGGLLVITMLSKDRWPPNAPGSELEFGTRECTPYFGSEIERMMLEAGFGRTWVVVDEDLVGGGSEGNRSNFSVLGRK